ncbi:MAG: 5'-nucleotidase C-terminal domain-containing protein [Planctomycetota bacterium]|jgi:5'-nucleotidase
MIDAPRERMRGLPLLRGALVFALGGLLAACGGGGAGSNDGEFVTRTGIVITGIVDDGTPTSPVAGGTCRVIDAAGRVLDTATTGSDGSYLVLLDPGLQAFIVCTDQGQSALALRTFVSTVGQAPGGELDGQDVLPSTTMLARIVAAEAADDPTLVAGDRLAALRAELVPFGSEQAPGNADLQLLADAATVAYDTLRDAGADVNFDALLTDLYDDGQLDFFGTLSAAAAVESAAADLVAAAGRSLADAVLATHPAFDFTILNVGGARSDLDEVARLATILEQARTELGDGASLTFSAGDTLSPGISLLAGLETQDPFFDALAVDLLGFDALAVGAEDLELGPPVYGIFLDRLSGPGVAVLTDIDASLEPNAFVPNAVASATAVLLLERRGRQIGVIGATPDDLPSITSTRSLITFDGADRIARLQSGIDGTLAAGARLVVLLTSVRSETALATLVGALRGVDVVVTLPGVPVVDAGFEGEGPRPQTLTTVADIDGRTLPVIPAIGGYAGLVEASLRADPLGELVAGATTGQVRRVATASEAQPTDENAEVRSTVLDPLAAAVELVVTENAAEAEIALDSSTASLLDQETNWGDLVADAVLITARSQAASYASIAPSVALVDVGSIDSADAIPAGVITRGEVFDRIDPGQVIAILQRVPPEDLKRLLEFSFANRGSERFAQVAGLFVEIDPDGTPQELDADGTVLVPGARVVNARLAGDTLLVQDGVPVAGGPTLTIAISERMRDQYPIADLAFLNIGITVAQTVDAFMRVSLNGNVSDENFPVGGRGRITVAEGN